MSRFIHCDFEEPWFKSACSFGDRGSGAWSELLWHSTHTLHQKWYYSYRSASCERAVRLTEILHLADPPMYMIWKTHVLWRVEPFTVFISDYRLFLILCWHNIRRWHPSRTINPYSSHRYRLESWNPSKHCTTRFHDSRFVNHFELNHLSKLRHKRITTIDYRHTLRSLICYQEVCKDSRSPVLVMYRKQID